MPEIPINDQEQEPVNRPTIDDIFTKEFQNIIVREDGSEPDDIDFTVLAGAANFIIYDSIIGGIPPEGGIYNATNQLRDAIHKQGVSESTRNRLHGMFDVLYQVGMYAPPRLDEEGHTALSMLQTTESIYERTKLDQDNFALTDQEGKTYPLGALHRQGLVVTVRIGEHICPELTPKGRAAIEAYQRQQNRE